MTCQQILPSWKSCRIGPNKALLVQNAFLGCHNQMWLNKALLVADPCVFFQILWTMRCYHD